MTEIESLRDEIRLLKDRIDFLDKKILYLENSKPCTQPYLVPVTPDWSRPWYTPHNPDWMKPYCTCTSSTGANDGCRE